MQSRIDWKYVLSLELADPGFDFSVLCEFRSRLVKGNQEDLLLNVLLSLCRERGWLKERGKQRTDSTHVVAAIRVMNRLVCVGETLRAALNALSVVAPQWLRAQVSPDWYDRYDRRIEDYRWPEEESQRQAIARQIGADGSQRLASALLRTGSPLAARHPSRRGGATGVGAAVQPSRGPARVAG